MFQQFLQSRFAVPAAIALIGLAVQFWPQLWALLALAWRQLPTFSPAPASPPAVAALTDENYLDMQAFYRLEARFDRANCKPGQDAMKQVAQHFLSHQD
jgi:hypothetical protein